MQFQENMVVADRFRLTRLIGRGGMGSVWGAVQLGLERACAVKFIEGELANVAEAHARFEREARAAAQLQSPNVVQIFDHGVWQGHPYIAMEFLDGEDLGKRLAKSGGRLAPAAVNTVVQQVCRALSKAHGAGIVHRDLKPDNIFLVTDDDREIVKILDFGVAKQTSQAIDGSNTKTGAMLGTPYYMSPEQAQGIKSVDARSDLWSLAVIVFQCLTGRLPFESEALGDLLVKIIVSPIPSPTSYAPDIPPGFERWWQKASDRNVDGRYQTAKEFAHELAVALGQTNPTGELTDRHAAQRIGGATALMQNSPPMEVMNNRVNTPNPGAQTAALMTTPQPAYQNPQAAAQRTPSNPYGQQAPMQAPHAMSTGSPVAGATFSGVDSPAVPKKSPPVAVFVGVGLLAVIGLGLGGFAMMKRSQQATAGAGSATADTATATTNATASANSSSRVPPSADPHASAAASAPASASASATSVATAEPSSAPSAASATPPATVAGGGTPPTTPVAVAQKPVTTPSKPVAKPPSNGTSGGAPPAQSPAKPSGTKPINLGF
ncbi:MAG: serine/threonine protein kinase [Deltaproteobacteria bacterium]|nr:serine/threonine protein kinase [Deltaproteobacteria bacterium]